MTVTCLKARALSWLVGRWGRWCFQFWGWPRKVRSRSPRRFCELEVDVRRCRSDTVRSALGTARCQTFVIVCDDGVNNLNVSRVFVDVDVAPLAGAIIRPTFRDRVDGWCIYPRRHGGCALNHRSVDGKVAQSVMHFQLFLWLLVFKEKGIFA